MTHDADSDRSGTDEDASTKPASSSAHSGPSRSLLAKLSIPAALIGVVSALILAGIEELAALLEASWWRDIPEFLGVDPDSSLWIFSVLSTTGLLCGLVLWLMPGHGGRDSATTELIAPPLPLSALPSLAIVTTLTLAGGVSLGPESPIVAINAGVLVALIARIMPRFPRELVVITAAAGTIGALFGSPLAAALIFTGVLATAKNARAADGSLWDRLFVPMVSATTGALTMTLLNDTSLTAQVPDFSDPTAVDFLSAALISVLAACCGLVAVALFPHTHRWFHAISNPLIMSILGGVTLGVVGAIGGPLTLFKGSDQIGELLNDREHLTPAILLSILGLKLAALVISASAGFRGGRIFPAIFLGAAFGMFANALFPDIPLAVALAAGVFGVTMAIAREGWLAIFVAVALTGSAAVLSLLCLALLPTWLLVCRAPEMIIRPETPRDSEATSRDAPR